MLNINFIVRVYTVFFIVMIMILAWTHPRACRQGIIVAVMFLCTQRFMTEATNLVCEDALILSAKAFSFCFNQ